MVSLVKTKKEIEKDRKRFDADVPMSFEIFPVSIHFGTEEVQKLNLSGVQVGEELNIAGRVRVASVSMNQRTNGDSSESVSVDILDLEVADDETLQEVADALFSEER